MLRLLMIPHLRIESIAIGVSVIAKRSLHLIYNDWDSWLKLLDPEYRK